MSSAQNSLFRIRPARVRIIYEVETGGAIQKKELPFIVGILADLAGDNSKNLPSLKERSFIEIDGGNFDQVLKSLNPTIKATAINKLKKEEKIEKFNLSFQCFDDFLPGNIANQIPDLAILLTRRKNLLDLTTKLDGNEVFASIIEKIISTNEARNLIKEDIEAGNKENIHHWIEEANMLKADTNVSFLENFFVSLYEALKDSEPKEVNDSYAFIINLIGKIDEVISLQMDEILHSSEFQKIEAAWRGLKLLVSNTETSTRLKLKVLCITKQELSDDLSKAVEFDQSCLFKKIYSAEYDTLGGTPYSCLVGDFAFGKSNPDIQLLRNISSVAAAAHAPFIGSVDPSMFDIESFSDLSTPRDLESLFESSELAGWNSFRETDDSRYVSLVLPKVLMRLPYHNINNPCLDFSYNEVVDGTDNTKFCWGNPGYLLANRITEAFATYSWTAAIRGVEGGGKVDNLPAFTFKTSNGDIVLKCPCQTAITDRREAELSKLGFISLCHAKGSAFSVFFGSQTTQKAKKYNLSDANANAAISTRLPYLLNASRFAHYIKMLIRDKIGSFLSAKEVEVYLQNWIADYVLLSDDGPQSLKAQYPLREAKITVVDSPDNPGSYQAIMSIRPHFQLEELSVSLRLVAKL